METVETLDTSPFKKLVLTIGGMPTAFMESMTYYEALAWLVNYIENTVIPAVNNNAEALEELQTAFVTLKNYVDNYFDNLDVQEEINNKLDEMVESGELSEIISQYLNSTAIFGYDTLASMKAAENLIAGSYARTLGYNSKNDGGGALYKIREILNTDVVNEGSIVAMADEDLVAELIVTNTELNVKQFGVKGDGTTNDTTKLQNAINYASNNGLKCFIPSGTYLISKVSITENIELCGNGLDTVIKSIDANSQDSLIYVENAGVTKSSIHDFKIDGNRSNTTYSVDGIKLYINNVSYVGDQYMNIYNIEVTAISGNGITFDSNQTSAFREMRLDNININSGNAIGMNLKKMTDSIITRCTVSGVKQYGYYIPDGGSNKFTDCKAFWCGGGDGTTVEEGNRIPDNAFTVTADETPQAGKYYYTRSGTNAENDYYEFTRFTGSTFDGGTTYYELTTFYPKRYAGFYVSSTASMFSNCESQENYGDGFIITASENKFSNVSCDNNGLITVDGNPVSYASQSKTQLYYGIYVSGWQFYGEGCCFLNHLNSSIGKSQKAGVYFYGGGNSTIKGTQSNQVSDSITIQKVSNPLTLSANLNNVEWRYNMPTSRYLLMNTGFALTDTDNNYLYFENGYIYYRLCVKKSDDSGIMNGTSNVKLFNFQAGCRPYTSTRLSNIGYATDNGGLLYNGIVTNYIYTWGDCEVKYIDTSLNTSKQVIVTGSFRVKLS